jgi:hypothetical protein
MWQGAGGRRQAQIAPLFVKSKFIFGSKREEARKKFDITQRGTV